MNRIFYKILIILACIAISAGEAYSCSPFTIPTLNSQTINGTNLELQWTSCTGWSCNYEVKLELRCNSDPFTGVFNYTSPMISKPSPTCLPFPLMIIDISSLCPGQTYKFRAKECWISSSSCSGLTTTFTFVVPGGAPLAVTASASPAALCLSGCTNLSAIATNACGSLTYTWDNGLGSGQNQSACPATTTTYNVTVTDDGCGTPTAMASVTVIIDLPPVAGTAAISPISICPGLTTNLTLTGYSGNIQWQQSSTSGGPWSNIGGATGASYTTTPLTSITYFQAEISNLCGLVTSNEIMVIMDPIPSAAFGFTSECQYNPILFTDSSTIASGSVVGWAWDFGDGNTSNLQNPSNQYTSDGTYNVKLVAISDMGCTDSIIQTITVHPVPNAIFNTDNVCLYDNAVFTDASTINSGSITSWNWNFGDGNTSTQQNPSYLYATSGLYNVTLLVTSNNGCVDSITKDIAVHYIPLANFTAAPVCLNDATVFNDISQIAVDSIVAWQWDFGDGIGNSTLQNPTYLFGTTDTFIVTLTVTSDSGCVAVVGYQVIVNPLPVANFTTANVCLYDSAVFTDGSTISSGNVNSWQWDFGDGNASSAQNPAHLYSTDSTYNVTLIVSSINNCLDTTTQPIDIYPIPIADFSTNNVCLYDPAIFTDASTTSSGNIIAWGWDFGDSNTSTIQSPTYLYSTDGTYYVSLFVTTNNSCVDTIVDTLIIYPVPSASFTTGPVCLYDAAVFTDVTTINNPDNIASWQWDFGDGLGTSTIQNPSYNYGSDGLYNVQLTVTSNNNCIDNTALTIEIYPLPVLNFISDTLSGCEPLCVNFTDSTTISGGTISFWDWDFGDGNTSTEQNPENCYTAIDVNTTRISTVTLIATSSNGCLDTLLWVDMITTWPNPIAEFTAEPQPTTIMNPVIYFTDQSQGNTITWAWDFGDPASSETAFIQNPEHEYSDTGTYIVEQIIVNQFSCSDTFYRTVIIQPDYIFHIPTAFTPDNQDGINDKFFPKGIGIAENGFEMYIYDRWGDLIYETNDINKPWDGRTNNGRKIAQQDVYIWMIFTKDMQGKRHKYIGRVTLIR